MAETLLLRNAAYVATFDDGGAEFPDASVFIRDNVIEAVGPASTLPQSADNVIDARHTILLPGLVNTHHHFYQTLTRNVPGTQEAGLFDWLKRLYPIWARLTPDAIRISTVTAIAELMRSGCTTSADQTYIWPNGARLDDQITVAREMGFRFHAGRGSMSLGQTRGGLPPDDLVEDEADILRDSQRLIERYHDAAPRAMTRVVLAPCSPFSVSPNLMKASIALARAAGVHVHTHLAETLDEERYCLETFNRRPVEFAEDLGWVGEDVWHAHVVHPSRDECARLSETRTGVAHCPSSNMRLGSGIAPLIALMQGGARVGLGVDGSASNDSSHMLGEARQAMLLQRVTGGPAALSARDSLKLATRGGASVLGRDDIGALAPGMAADIIGYRLDTLELSGGAVHDPVAALVFCRPSSVDLSIINGRVRIQDGEFVDFDLPRHIARHNDLARSLARG